jgi:DNA-binding MarR family transcriptional regulator
VTARERGGRRVSTPIAVPPLTLDNLGFLLAKSSQRWNELLYDRFVAAGFPEVRPAYGSLLIPLYEEDGLRQGELARRARLSKQTMTTMARTLERDGLVERRVDQSDARATQIFLTERARELRPVAEQVLKEVEALVGAALAARARETLKTSLRQIAGLDRPIGGSEGGPSHRAGLSGETTAVTRERRTPRRESSKNGSIPTARATRSKSS